MAVRTRNEITLAELRELTAIQAEDEVLWEYQRTIDAGYIQQALRHLTRAIEGDWTFEEARDAIREMMP